MSRAPLPGFRDFYPEEFAQRSHIMRVWRDVAHRFAFSEYDAPPLEPLELYTRKSGDEIVGQLYAFTDKGDRAVALRPEMTPSLARMVGARANALRKPVRWFSIPQLFRYERAQRGRLREHFQLNVDIVGEADVTADAELVAVAIEIMRAFGLSHQDVRVRVSDRRLLQGWLEALGISGEAMPAVFAVIDKVDRVPVEVTREKLVAAGASAKACEAIAGVASIRFDALAGALEGFAGGAYNDHVEEFSRFERYVRALTGDGDRWLQFDLSIVRGLAYYTGIVFELFDARGELRAICGGGRYDSLLGALGGADLPALGFGMGDVVLGELLKARGLMPGLAMGPDFWVIGSDRQGADPAMRVAAELRAKGFAVEYALRPQKPDKQHKAAQSAGARYVLQLHEEFGDNRVVSVREARPATGRRSLLEFLSGADVALDRVIEAAAAHRSVVF
ncbi:MAG: histidine--tRNA ligase [Gemmatimonadetes bacterium]|nr:histidine--tRNA ligase [Gemmatimonadota bacterium]